MKALDVLARALSGARESPDADDDTTATRILDAGRRQLELFGIQRTTMEDIGRRSGVSRVTVYRHFPNREVLFEAVIRREVETFLRGLATHVEQFASDEDQVVEGFVFTVRALREHALLQRLLESEPELFVPQVTVQGGPLIAMATAFLVERIRTRPAIGVSTEELTILVEVGVRLTLSFLLTPQSAIDLDDTARVRAVARRYLIPMLAGDPPRGRRRA